MHDKPEPAQTQTAELAANCVGVSSGTATLTTCANLEGVATMIARGED